jgi:hypothetical protein
MRRKVLALCLLLVLASSMMFLIQNNLGLANAETSIPKPYVPQFTLQVEDSEVYQTIWYQPIIPNGHDTAGIFFHNRIKSHDSTNWVNINVPDPSQAIRGYITEEGTIGSTLFLKKCNSIALLLGLPNGIHQIDYQVEAINGYINSSAMYAPGSIDVDPSSLPVIIVNTSGWSPTQTVTITTNAVHSEFLFYIIMLILLVFMVVTVAGLLVFFNKHRHSVNNKQRSLLEFPTELLIHFTKHKEDHNQ